MPRRSKASVIRMVVSLFATYRRYADSATTQLDPVTRPAIKRGDSKLGERLMQSVDDLQTSDVERRSLLTEEVVDRWSSVARRRRRSKRVVIG